MIGDAGELCEAAGGGLGVDVIAGTEPGHSGTDRFDPAGQVTSADGNPWPAQAQCRAHDVRPADGDTPVCVVDGGRVHADEHLVRPGSGLVDVLQSQDVARSVRVLDDRAHHTVLSGRRGMRAGWSGLGTRARGYCRTAHHAVGDDESRHCVTQDESPQAGAGRPA
jgi:hypothetical protein